MLAGGLMFVLVGVLLVLASGVVGWLVGGVCIAFFGTAAAYLLAEIVWRRPTVVMDRDGVTVRAYLGAPGRLSWADVTGARTYRIGRQRMLALNVADESALVTRMSPLSRFFARANRGLGYPVVNVPQSAVAEDLDEVVTLMRGFKPDLRSTGDD
jgi:hypothetical protein